MLPASVQLLFFATALLLALAPGPDNLFVIAQAVQHGWRAGLLVTAGLCTGLLFHSAAVTFGLATLFAASRTFFILCKFFGAGYLLYLAWQALCAANREGAGAAAVAALPAGRLYRRGIVMNLTNPKVSIFFLAFLPQFANPAYGPLAVQLLLLGGLFIVATIVIFSALSLLAGLGGGWLRQSPAAQRLLNGSAAAISVILALHLLVSQR